MKPTKISPDIHSRHGKTVGSGPNLGKVSRVRDPKGPQVVGWTRSRGGGDNMMAMASSAAKRRTLFAWSIGFALVTLLLVIGFTLFWLRSHRNVPAVVDFSETPENVRIVSRFVSPTEDEALSLVKRALANRDPKRVETLMRCVETDPENVVEFMAGLESLDGPITRISWLSSMDVEGMLIEGVLVASAGKSTPVERLALLVPDEKGSWKMDYDAFARTSTPSWKDFLEGRAESARVRVLVSKDSYFNGPFSDESRWVCYSMVSPEAKEWLPDDQGVLCGYCRSDSPQAKAMVRVFIDGGASTRATIEIQRTKGADSRQFEITRVLSEEWVLPDKPFDEKFD